jgi:hypothetical protein
MGIENTAGAQQPVGIMKLQARPELRAIFVRKTVPYEPTPANATIGDEHRWITVGITPAARYWWLFERSATTANA